MTKEASNRKRVNLKEGDVFEITVPDGRLGYGVVVLRGGGVPYVIVLASLHNSRPNVSELVGDEIALVGWTMDALVYHGRWLVVAHDFPKRNDVPFPNWKVGMEGKTYVTDVAGNILAEASAKERDLLDYQSSRAPIAFQNAFESMHGFGEWKASYDKITPAYARKRVTRR